MQDSSPQTPLTRRRWQRVQAIFERAEPLGPEARVRLLMEECADDASLREQVQALLLASESEGDELEMRFDRAIASTLRGSELPDGMIIGRYRVRRLLGSGGMGAVYLAERADEQYQQIVALKLMRRDVLHRGVAGQFRSERQILARLSHPNIARLLDGGHTEDGAPYLVMEYIEGSNIDAYCREHDLSIPARLRLMQQLCAAVEFAHQNLIVHRDLKPSNILVTADGVPRLLDFGIAKLLDPRISDTGSELTRARDRVLTPEYASPEQLRGEPLGTVSDVYSLGTLLYVLLSGSHPHVRPEQTMPEFEAAVCEREPPAPSLRLRELANATQSRTLYAQARELTGDLDNIVLKAMHRDPQRRYQSAAAFAQDIESYLTGMPVGARPDTWTYRASKFIRRNRVEVASAAAAVVISIGLTIFYTQRLAVERDREALEAAKAKQVAHFLAAIFRVTNPYGSQGQPITPIEVLDRGTVDAEQQLRDQPPILADLLYEIADSYKGLGAYDRAARVFDRSLAIRKANGLDNTPEFADSLAELANAQRFLGRFSDAERSFKQALEMQQRLYPPPSAPVAATMTHLGTLYHEMQRWDDALRLQQEALPMTVAVFGVQHAESADRMNNLALALQGEGQYAQAHAYFEKAIDVQAQVLPPMHPDALGTRTNLYALLGAEGHYREAERQLEEIMPARRIVLGKNHPRLGISLMIYGRVQTSLGQFDAAQASLTEAVDILSSALGEQHFRTGQALRAQGELALARGDFAGAAQLFSRAEQIRTSAFGAGNAETLRLRSMMAVALLGQAKLNEAQLLLEQSYQHLYGAGHSPTADDDRTLEGLAQLRLAQGRLSEAALLYEQARDKYQHYDIASHPRAAEALLGLAEIARREHRVARAVSLSRHALNILRAELPDSHWQVAMAQVSLGQSLLLGGHPQQAATLIARGRKVLSVLLPATDPRRVAAEAAMREVEGSRERASEPLPLRP